MSSPSVIVVGAGIVGTSTAWALATRDWDVTLLDAGPVPNPAGSSGGVHRLIRSTYGAYTGYAAMVPAAYDVWESLWATLGRSLMTRTGMLAVDSDGSTFASDSAASLDRLSLPYAWLDEETVRRRWPQFQVPDGAVALHTDDAHFLRAREIVGATAAWLADRGVTVRPHTRVDGVDLDAGTVRLADGEQLSADRVVVAAGPWTGRLLGELSSVLTPSRQVVVDLAPPPALRGAWATAPAFLLLPAYGIPPRDELALKVGDHAFSLTGDPDEDRHPRPEEVAAVLSLVGRVLTDLDRYEVLDARSCYYTVADDERFTVEARGERGVVCAGFSGHGFKFGPLVGRAVAAALVGELAWDVLSRWAAGHLEVGWPVEHT